MMDIEPKVILFRGLPGVGKTYLSTLISEENKYAIIRKDDVYDIIYSYLKTHEERNEVCYSLINKLINTNLKVGVDLIIDCPFREHEDLDVLAEFIKIRNGVFKPILCECRSAELWKKRFNSRDLSPNNLIRSYEELKTYYKTMYLERYEKELVIDTQESVENLRIKIREYITTDI